MAPSRFQCWPGSLFKFVWRTLKQRRRLGPIGLTFLLVWAVLAIMVLNPHSQTPHRDLTANISQFFRIQRDPFFNLHHYKFSLNSKVCERKDLDVLVTVHSKPDFFRKRQVIRETLGTVKQVGNTSLSIVFMLGRVDNKTLQGHIQEEFNTYGDIVQGNFVDNYKNMTHKHVMLMHWIENQCPHVKVIVKIDDDVIVNPYNLVKYIDTTSSLENSFHCLIVRTEVPDRNPNGRYHIPYEQYPFDILPEYCPGFAYITTPEVYRKLCRVSRDVRYLNMDDVFVTGVLALRTGVKKVDISKGIFHCISHYFKSPDINDFIFILDERDSCKQETSDIWKELKQN